MPQDNGKNQGIDFRFIVQFALVSPNSALEVAVVKLPLLNRARIAQTEEQLICNQQVVGSNPSAGSRNVANHIFQQNYSYFCQDMV